MSESEYIEDAPPTIVFLEGDSSTLVRQRLELIRKFASLAQRIPTAGFKFIPGVSREQIRQGVREWASEHDETKVLVVAAHSNREGVKLDPGELVLWSEFAGLIAPLNPTYLIMIACEAGSWEASKVLLNQVDSLYDIYASPTNMTENGAAIYLLLIPALLYGIGWSRELELAIQAVTFTNSGNVLYRISREHFERVDRGKHQRNALLDEVMRFASWLRGTE